MAFGMEKPEWCGYPMVKKFWKLFVLTECTNVMNTHRQTDTAWQHRPHLHSIAWQKANICNWMTVSCSWTKLSSSVRRRLWWQMRTALHSTSSCQQTGHWLVSWSSCTHHVMVICYERKVRIVKSVATLCCLLSLQLHWLHFCHN